MKKKHLLDAEYRYMLMASLFWFAQNVYNPYLTTYLTSIGISASFAGVVVGAWGLTQILGCFSIGFLSDLFRSHWKILCFGQCAMVAASILLCTVQVPWVYLAAKLISGITASTWSCGTIYFSHFSRRKSSSQSMFCMLLSICSGALTSYLFGAVFYDFIGMRGMFIACGAAAAAAVLLLQSLRDESQTDNRSKISIMAHIKTILHSRSIWECALIAAMANAVIFSTTYSFIANYAKSIGAKTAQLALVSAMHTIGCLIGSGFMSTGLLKHFHPRKICICSYLLLSFCCFLVPLSSSIGQIYIIQILYGIARDTPLGLLMAAAVQETDAEQKSTAMGLMQSVYNIGTTIGPMLMGFLMQWFVGYTIPYWIFAGISLICVAVSYFVKALRIP